MQISSTKHEVQTKPSFCSLQVYTELDLFLSTSIVISIFLSETAQGDISGDEFCSSSDVRGLCCVSVSHFLQNVCVTTAPKACIITFVTDLHRSLK